jgi:hypothetical protein
MKTRPSIPFLPLFELWYPEGDVGTGGTGGTGAGTGGTGTGGAGAGGGTGTPISLTPDSLVIPPGAKAPIKYSEYIGGYMPKAEYDTWQTTRTEAEKRLIAEAARLDRQAERSRRTEDPPPDPFKSVEDLELVDGKTLAQLARQGFGGVAKQIGDQQRMILTLQKQITDVAKSTKSYHTERNERDYYKRIDDAVSALAVDPEIAKMTEFPEMRELAQDIYGSFEPGAELDQKLPTLLAGRIEKLRAIFRAMDRADAKKQVEKLRTPPAHGRVVVDGKPGRLESNSDIARRYFPQSTGT